MFYILYFLFVTSSPSVIHIYFIILFIFTGLSDFTISIKLWLPLRPLSVSHILSLPPFIHRFFFHSIISPLFLIPPERPDRILLTLILRLPLFPFVAWFRKLVLVIVDFLPVPLGRVVEIQSIVAPDHLATLSFQAFSLGE